MPTAQSVAYSTSPVAVTSCSVNESYASGMIGGELVEASQFMASDITLKFVNRSQVPATTVKFFVNDGKFTQSIVDNGAFSPGVQIKHNFAVGNGISELSTPRATSRKLTSPTEVRGTSLATASPTAEALTASAQI